jgi:hypothetical protein
MAYPTISAPYGLKPINLIGGQLFAGQTRELPITTLSVSYSTPLYNGQVVQIDGTNGTIIAGTMSNGTSAVAGTVGVFVGCSYTNPSTGQKLFQQYWPGFASGVTDAVAYVVDDPDALFKVASVGATADSTGLNVTGIVQTALGANVALVLNSANTSAGNARTGIYYNSGAAATTYGFRIVDLVPDTSVTESGITYYNEVIVKFNFGFHSYYNAAGVA